MRGCEWTARHGSANGSAHQFVRRRFRERLTEAGWAVTAEGRGVDAFLRLRRGDRNYVAVVGSTAAAGTETLLGVWAQSAWRALRLAEVVGGRPLAVAVGAAVSERTAAVILDFATCHAAEVSAAVVGRNGLMRFADADLAMFDTEADVHARHGAGTVGNRRLFSDINQWILKVLLAAELPEALLTAPRRRYRTAAQLADAAGVSAMSVSRLFMQLRSEHFLSEPGSGPALVRRGDLLRRWQAWTTLQRPPERGYRFLLRAHDRARIARLLERTNGILATHAAADALGYGFVTGVPTTIYLASLPDGALPTITELVPAREGEVPDIVLRAPAARQSVARGAVSTSDGRATDVLQTWLDVGASAARGAEQAAVFERGPLHALLRDA